MACTLTCKGFLTSINWTLDFFFLAIGPLVRVTSLALGASQSAFRDPPPSKSGLGLKIKMAQVRCLVKEDIQLRLDAASLHQEGKPGWFILKDKLFTPPTKGFDLFNLIAKILPSHTLE